MFLCTVKSIAQADLESLTNISLNLTGLDFYRTHIPMWVFDKRTMQFLAVNLAAVEHYGFSKEEFLRMSVLDIRPVEDVPRLLQETMSPRGHDREAEIWRHRTKEGRVFPVQITGYQIEFGEHPAELIVARELSATLNEFAKKSKAAKA